MYLALCIKELHSCVKRVYGCSGAGTGGQGAAASLPFYREGQYCPMLFSTIVTKQTPANLKACLSDAE